MASDKGRRFHHLVPLLRKYKGYLWFGAAATLLANGLMLINPYLVKLAFDAVQAKAPTAEIRRLALVMVSLAVVAGVFHFSIRRTIIWASRKIEYDLRNLFFEKLLALDCSYYHRTKTGDLMAHATNDIEAVRMMIGPGVMHVISSAFSVTIALMFMATLSMRLTLYTFLPMTLLSLAVYRLGGVVHRKFVTIQAQFSRLTIFAQENLAGIRVIKAYRREPSEIERFGQASRQYADLNMDMMRVVGLFQPLLYFIAGTVALLVLFVGGSDVASGRISLGTLAAFFGYLAWLAWPMMSFGWVISLYQRGTASLDRLNKILETQPLVKDAPTAAPAAEIKGRIEFQDLTFAYPAPDNSQSEPVLKNIDLLIEPGTRLGIIGPTGSGKTTLVSLIPRLYPLNGPGCSGRLLIDSLDADRWPLEALRQAVGFVPQEPFLFSDTLKANVGFGSDDLAAGDVVRAAETAAFREEAESFPAGYESILGERGITLSGGQKQRATLARAILKNPAILILDDATSSVDTETEEKIFARLHDFMPGRTSLLISHRVASVKDCDRIIYLEDGRIAEQGTHEELLDSDGRYTALHRRQQAEAELEKM